MLCRACGGEMSATEFCPSCNEGILWKCTSCEKENDKSVHTHYLSSDELKTVPSSLVGALACLATSLVVVV